MSCYRLYPWPVCLRNLSRLTIPIIWVLELAGKLNLLSEFSWTASPKSPCSPLSLIDIYSFLVVSVFLARSLTVSVNKPPTSMLSTSLAILPTVAGEIFLLEVNVWVRLSISDVCDPGSGFLQELFSHYISLLVLFVPSTLFTADSILRAFPPVTLLSPDMSLLWSSELCEWSLKTLENSGRNSRHVHIWIVLLSFARRAWNGLWGIVSVFGLVAHLKHDVGADVYSRNPK